MERIVLQNVSKRFSKQLTILNAVNYTFEAGKFYGIIGDSGVGKTTLLQILGTLDEPTEGKILIDGRDIERLGIKERAELRNKQIGFVFQSFFLNANLTAVENVMMPMLISAGFAECQKRAEQLLEQMGLGGRLSHFPAQLSGGEQQRVAIARALVNKPKIILADEPTGNLDETNEEHVINILQALAREGITVVMVTHNKQLLSKVDQILRLEAGRLVEAGE